MCWRGSGRADSTCGQENIDTAARSEVEDRFAFLQFGQRRRIAAAEGGENCCFGQLSGLLVGIKVGCYWACAL